MADNTTNDPIQECTANSNNNTNNNNTCKSIITIVLNISSFHTTSQQYALNVTYILVSVFGIIGKILALVVIFTNAPIRRRLLNYYFINQTIVDFLVSLLLIPSVTVGLIPFGYSTNLLCLAWQSRVIFLSLYNVSVNSILSLSVERYLEIVHPIWHKLHVTRVKVLLSILIVWLIGFVQKCLFILPTTRPVNGVCMLAKFYPSRTVSSVTGFINFIIHFLLLLSLISFCYIQMWRSLRNKIKSHPSPAVLGNVQSGPKFITSSQKHFKDSCYHCHVLYCQQRTQTSPTFSEILVYLISRFEFGEF